MPQIPPNSDEQSQPSEVPELSSGSDISHDASPPLEEGGQAMAHPPQVQEALNNTAQAALSAVTDPPLLSPESASLRPPETAETLMEALGGPEVALNNFAAMQSDEEGNPTVYPEELLALSVRNGQDFAEMLRRSDEMYAGVEKALAEDPRVSELVKSLQGAEDDLSLEERAEGVALPPKYEKMYKQLLELVESESFDPQKALRLSQETASLPVGDVFFQRLVASASALGVSLPVEVLARPAGPKNFKDTAPPSISERIQNLPGQAGQAIQNLLPASSSGTGRFLHDHFHAWWNPLEVLESAEHLTGAAMHPGDTAHGLLPGAAVALGTEGVEWVLLGLDKAIKKALQTKTKLDFFPEHIINYALYSMLYVMYNTDYLVPDAVTPGNDDVMSVFTKLCLLNYIYRQSPLFGRLKGAVGRGLGRKFTPEAPGWRGKVRKMHDSKFVQQGWIARILKTLLAARAFSP